jgi:hypothetical protein
MARTTLCVITAGALATVALGVMIVRYQVLGREVKVPAGPGTWKVTLLVNGKSQGKSAKLLTATPLDFGRQHILREACRSEDLLDKPADARHPDRRQVLWTLRAGVPNRPFRARYEFYCSVGVQEPTLPMTRLAKTLYAPPHPGEHLNDEPRVETDQRDISEPARRLTAGRERSYDRAEALFRYVANLCNEPSVGGPALGAVACLNNGGGDPEAKSRLLVALCRNRGIPARLVHGLVLSPGAQAAHVWVEAWLREQWLAMCPFHHHFGRVPPTYLVFGFGEQLLVRGRHVSDLDYAFLVEPLTPEGGARIGDGSVLRRLLTALSLYALPPAEQRLVEFLLLLPVAALIVCVYRNVIGVHSFGTFAPALVGLAFRDLRSLPGILVFGTLVLIGWALRRALDRYHLLQVPRMALLLSLVVIVLIAAIVAANFQDLPATKYISLFPLVILTAMIERFWTLEVEDGTSSSFRTLLGTLVIAASISLLLSLHAVVSHLFRYPETLGLIMAAQLLLGRYTGYRLSELYRFREFLRQPALSGGK